MGLTYKCLISWAGCLSLVEGYSVNKAIEACKKATARRPGSPARLVASRKKFMKSWDGKRSICWKRLLQVHGNGIAEMQNGRKPPSE